VVCQDWARIRKQSIRWLQAPTSIGGLGILHFEGWVPSQPWPHVEHPSIVFTNIQPESYMTYQKKFQHYTLNETELKQVQQQSLIEKTASDDIRGLGVIFRDKYSHAIQKLRETTWRRVEIDRFKAEPLFAPAYSLSKIRNHQDLSVAIRSVGDGFGRYIGTQQWWTETQSLSRVRDVRPMELLREYNLEMFCAIRSLERKGLHRGSAMDYVFGNIAGLVVSPLSPLLASVVQSALSLAVIPWVQSHSKWNRETWGWFTSTVAHWYAEQLNNSPLSLTLFQW